MPLLIIFIIALAVAIACQPKPSDPAPASFSDINAPTAEPGRAIPVVFGTVLVKCPNVVWYGDLGYSPIRSGGK